MSIRPNRTIAAGKVMGLREAFERELVRVTGGEEGVIRDIVGTCGGLMTGENHPVGINLLAGKRWLVRDVKISGVIMADTDRAYMQGDGFKAEADAIFTRFDNCEVDGAGDAGFDIKGLHAYLRQCRARDCAKSFRFWSPTYCEEITSLHPRNHGGANTVAHIGIHHSSGETVIEELIARDDGATPLVWFDPPGGTVRIKKHNLGDRPKGAPIKRGVGTIIWETGAPV